MKSIYVSGPLRADTLHKMDLNVRVARDEAELLWKIGFAVLCPHLNTLNMIGMLGTDRERNFLEGDLALMKSMDIICMLPGWEDSEGACREHAEAFSLGMDCVYRIANNISPTWNLARKEKEAFVRLSTKWTTVDLMTYARLT